ncbi:MAG TPA: glycosyltransferase family 2 protein [Thermodesulfobacteriota bacterium]|nr:glycosyltransferase family 2 protein [Thermodesulfobacteriota bacterium]
MSLNINSISVVLPAFNEEENIGYTIQNCVDYMQVNNYDYEVIVVNDGSSDNTKDIVQKAKTDNSNVVLVDHDINKGYGAALRSGFESAQKDYVFLMDSDRQFNIEDIEKLFLYLDEQTVVVGYRQNRADPVIRKINAYLFHIYIKLMFGLNLRDIDCAFKVFPTQAYQQIKPIISDGALFSTEFIIRLLNKGYGIKEIAVNHYPRLKGSQSGANISVILKMFAESWNLRKILNS